MKARPVRGKYIVSIFEDDLTILEKELKMFRLKSLVIVAFSLAGSVGFAQTQICGVSPMSVDVPASVGPKELLAPKRDRPSRPKPIPRLPYIPNHPVR